VALDTHQEETHILHRLTEAMAGRLPPAEAARVGKEADALFAAHQDRVYAICYRFVGNAERARELAQDVLLTAWVKLPEFRGDSSFGTWLYGIARNLCFRAMRKRGENLLEADGVVETADPRASALSALRRREREDLLRRASLVLQPLEQEAVHLRYVEHLPQDRITKVLGLDSASGARGLLQRCRRKLSREMNRLLEELGHGTSFVRSSVT